MRARSVSSKIICCVLIAIRAAFSLGSEIASSYEFVCSDCVPPNIAPSACSVTRTIFSSGSWEINCTPAVCVWNLKCMDFGSRMLYLSRINSAHTSLAALNLQISSISVVLLAKKKLKRLLNNSKSISP